MNFVDKDGTTEVYIPVHPWDTLCSERIFNQTEVILEYISYKNTSFDYFINHVTFTKYGLLNFSITK